MKHLQYCTLCLVITVGLGGCGGMVKTTRVVNGETQTIWTTPENLERMDQEEENQRLRYEQNKNSFKKSVNDPIRVALFRPVIEGEDKQGMREDELFRLLKEKFADDKTIILIEQNIVDENQSMEKFQGIGRSSLFSPPQLNADAIVKTTAFFRKDLGVNKHTGKVGDYLALVISGKVTSEHSPQEYELEVACQAKLFEI